MKIKIKIRTTDPSIFPIITKKGDWIDLESAETVSFLDPHNSYNTRITKFDSKKISLGIAMQLPYGFEAIIAPRSSLFNKKGLILVNSIGIIDSSYNGDNDIWGATFLATSAATISKNERIVQFRIQPSQFAPWWVKLKWFFTSKIVFKKVEYLENPNRGGWGSSGGYKNNN